MLHDLEHVVHGLEQEEYATSCIFRSPIEACFLHKPGCFPMSTILNKPNQKASYEIEALAFTREFMVGNTCLSA
jgi:hypothetical protein